MHQAEPRWLLAPPNQGLPVPFLKGVPRKVLDNDQMLYEADTPKGKLSITAKYKETYEMSKG
jgi:hypothetical protein